MEFNILNKDRQWIGVVDRYKSAIWTPRYWAAGDFEIYAEATEENLSILQKDYYVTRPDDDMACFIQKVNIVTDEDGGKYLIVTGECLKSILKRRIVWQQTTLRGTVEKCIRKLIDENIISPTINSRKIPEFFMYEEKGFAETVEMQVTGDNLFDVVSSLCQSYGYGFKVTFNDDRQFMFELYKGEDRSYEQDVNPYVVFSPDFDNVKSVDYVSDKTNYKNVALVAGEGEGTYRKTATVGSAAGLERYEIYVDARDISTNDEEISTEDYNKLLAERGNEDLAASIVQESFEGEVEASVNYTYKEDYFLGDIIQIENEFGIKAAPRIVEIIECMDENGYSMTPTFDSEEG